MSPEQKIQNTYRFIIFIVFFVFLLLIIGQINRDNNGLIAAVIDILFAFALLIILLGIYNYFRSNKNPISPYIKEILNWLKNEGFEENENGFNYLLKKDTEHRQLFNLILQNTEAANVTVANHEDILSNCLKPIHFQKKMDNYLINWLFFREKMIGFFPSNKNKILLEILLEKPVKSSIVIYKQNPKTKFIWETLNNYGLYEDIDIESNYFNYKYQIFTQDHKTAFKILDPLIVDFLNHEPYITISIKNNSILVYLTKNLSIEEIKKYFTTLIKFARHVESVTE